MNCPNCEKLEFIITELKEQLTEAAEENRRLREIIKDKRGCDAIR